MGTEELPEILAAAQAQMLSAAAAQAPQVGTGASGSDPDGYVKVRVDGRGLLEMVTYDRNITDLTSDDLAESTLAALQDAHAQLQGSHPAHLPDIGRSEVHERLQRAFGLEGNS